ncbi:hypothetical protein BDN72DRAFT_849773 [Pluteus cervinus]|uniref:Uncharacterized protein n=1 Tax=Pluteus cervinus TaxID=181527 RepID=A0ACD3A7G1_9AGAR|nr:hypothetical protein BDN72DRAFT_849773 [Pluteus cervinus]
MESSTNPFSISGLTRLECFAKIDAELLRLHNLRNSLTPISTIPNELLSQTFLYTHHADADVNFAEGHSRLAISGVSRHWRSVALSCPTLWGLISYQDPWSMEYAQACFERSKDLDLSLSLWGCLQQINRLRDVEIKMTERGNGLSPLNHWTRPAPRLVSLLLQGFYFSSDELHPQLRRLTLLRCEFHQWRNLPLISAAGLTTLHIVDPQPRVSVNTTVRMLSLLPTLVNCELYECFPRDASQPPPRNEAPLTLSNVTKYCAFGLLNRLHLPIASVHIRSESTKSESWLRDAFQSFKECQARYLGDDDIRHISLESPQRLSISITTSTSIPTSLSAPPPPRRQFSINVPFSEPLQFDPVACAFDYLPLSHASLRSCSIDGVARETALYGLYRAPYLEVATIQSVEGPKDSGILNAIEILAKVHPPYTFLTSIRVLEVDEVVYETFQEFYDSVVEGNSNRHWYGTTL